MSIILSPILLKLCKLFINIAYFTGSIPFKWCEHEDGVYYPKTPRLNPFQWNVVKYIFIVNQVFISIRLGQSITEIPRDKYRYISSLIPQVIYATGLLVPTAIQILLIHQGRILQSTIHQFIRFSKDFQGKLQLLRKIWIANGILGKYRFSLILNIFRSVFHTWKNRDLAVAKVRTSVYSRCSIWVFVYDLVCPCLYD